MTALEGIVTALRAVPMADIDRANTQTRKVDHIPGWSGSLHYLFFEHCLRQLPVNPAILICGVYHGRDLQLLALAAEHLGLPVQLSGVDLFSNGPCADWTDEQRNKSWEENGFGPPPSMAAAKANCPEARIFQRDSCEFMLECGNRFNLVYLDTSHDYQSLKEEIAASRSALKPGALLAGDDYTGQPHWGVKQAVDEAFSSRAVFGDCIWMTQP